MNTITLTQDGAIQCNGVPLSSSPVKYLNHQVELGDAFTLRSYFKMLERYPLLSEINDFYPVLREQIAKCPEDGCTWPDFECLIFTKTVEIIGFPHEPRLEIFSTLRGAQNGGEGEIRSLMLENILDMPIRLGKLKHIVFGDKVDEFLFETVFTLFEFIDGITWELSFQNGSNGCIIKEVKHV